MKKKNYKIEIFNVISKAEMHIEATNDKEAKEIAELNKDNLEFKTTDDCGLVYKITADKKK
ncbi:MAG: hypothetical protein PHP92_03765 [Candidatus Nanoarchaeia archaeon]|nr:hypothetical protein [Candidatus Nanoarchaeia archaeon]